MFSFFKSLLCGCFDVQKNTRRLSRSRVLLMVSFYNLDYMIRDRQSGKRLDCDILEFDERAHTISVRSSRFTDSDFYV